MTDVPPTPPASSPWDDNDASANRLRDRLQQQFADAHDELMGTIFYCVGNHEDARDALQESFLKCWRNRDQIDGVENLRAWVFRIALNTGRDYRKAAWNRRRENLDEHPISEPTMNRTTPSPPEAALIQKEQLDQLQRALLSLRREEREVFLLRQNGDLTYEQIADAMDLPTGTVKTRMRAAIAQLRQAVGGQS